MTELEPVAWVRESDLKEMQESNVGIEMDVFSLWSQMFDVDVALVTLSSAQSAIAERDARIAELEAAVIAHMGVSDEMTGHYAAERARAEAAEALLKVYGELVDQAEHVCMGAHTPMDIRDAAKNLKEPLEKIYAARSLMSKIGERNGE